MPLTEIALENNMMVCEDREYRLGNDLWKVKTYNAPTRNDQVSVVG